jgi:hypothetical protein
MRIVSLSAATICWRYNCASPPTGSHRSAGRSETDVLPALDALLAALCRLCGEQAQYLALKRYVPAREL